jgi:hypothetical protein
MLAQWVLAPCRLPRVYPVSRWAQPPLSSIGVPDKDRSGGFERGGCTTPLFDKETATLLYQVSGMPTRSSWAGGPQSPQIRRDVSGDCAELVLGQRQTPERGPSFPWRQVAAGRRIGPVKDALQA